MTTDSVEWASQRPVYKHVSKDRYIFWNAHGLGWSIGKQEYLTSGSHWHRSMDKEAQVLFSNDFHFNQFKVDWIHPNLGKVVGTVESSWNVLDGRNLHNEMKVQKKKTQTKTITDLKLILDYSVPFSTFSDYSLDTLHLSLM